MRMILFLDIDGVLHPLVPRYRNGVRMGGWADPACTLCHLPRFESIMRDYPEVRIVISSNWRITRTLEKLRSYFSADIRPRIIDTTLVFSASYERQREILDWRKARDSSEPFCALDDAVHEFNSPDWLIACESEVGLDDRVEALLRRKLADCVS